MKLRLNIADKTVFYYPDLLLSCAPDDRQPYFSSLPCLIVEVLSDSTERIDRREKLLAYQTLPSLQEYVLVAQNGRLVEVYRRANDWKAEYFDAGRFGSIVWRAVCPLTPSMPTLNRLKRQRRTLDRPPPALHSSPCTRFGWLTFVANPAGCVAQAFPFGIDADPYTHNASSAKAGSIFNKASRPASARSRQPFPR